MTIEADLYTALGSLVSNRCYPIALPLNLPYPERPAIRYTLIAATPAIALCGDSGDESADYRVQLDCIAGSFKDARALRDSVLGAMASFSPPAVLQGSFSQFDPETKCYTEVLDYAVYISAPGL